MRIGKAAPIGTLITDVRRRLGLSQAQYAELAGVPQPTLSRLESGRIREPSLALVSRIVGALGTDLSGIIKKIFDGAKPVKGAAHAAPRRAAHKAAGKGASKATQV